MLTSGARIRPRSAIDGQLVWRGVVSVPRLFCRDKVNEMSLSKSQSDELSVLQSEFDQARNAYHTYVEPYASGVAVLPPDSSEHWIRVKKLRKDLHDASSKLFTFHELHRGS